MGHCDESGPGPTSESVEEELHPIFIVGCQRSGTTALAVMFDRHSRVAMLPETAFFTKFVKSDRRAGLPMSRDALIRRMVEHTSVKQAQMGFEDIVAALGERDPTYPNLFRALLECYTRKHGKQRPGEKTCGNWRHARELLGYYPKAKIICIVRDGRDVVLSNRKVSWGKSASLAALCRHWLHAARGGLHYSRELPSDSFALTKYEDLMTRPEHEMGRLCKFLGEEYEPSQLCGGMDTNVIPESEIEWKGKAKTAPDPSRVAAWQRCEDRELVARLTYYMGSMLRELGYPNTEVSGIHWARRLGWTVRYIPFRRGVFPVALWVNRVLRYLRSLVGQSATRRTGPPLCGDVE